MTLASLSIAAVVLAFEATAIGVLDDVVDVRPVIELELVVWLGA